MKGFGDSNAERNDRKRQSNNKELAMKKIILPRHILSLDALNWLK